MVVQIRQLWSGKGQQLCAHSPGRARLCGSEAGKDLDKGLRGVAEQFRLPLQFLAGLLEPAVSFGGVIDSGSGRCTARVEDAQGTPTQSRISPSILVYRD